MSESDMRTELGLKLWRILPRVYRERDVSGDLAATLDAFGGVLDSIHALLETRLRDTTPDTCQDWLLPYFAELFHERLVSRDAAGQRLEVGNAVQWRKRKGTLSGVESLAEAILGSEVELQEGFRRVAMTPRIGQALLPEASFGLPEIPNDGLPEIPKRSAAQRAAHPGLPAVTLDLRLRSRAVTASSSSPVTHMSRFPRPAARGNHIELVETLWRQAAPRGVPLFAGSYQDVSARLVDFRTPRPGQGLFHPRRLVAHVRPPGGFLEPEAGRAAAAVEDSLELGEGAPRLVTDRYIAGSVQLGPQSWSLQRVTAEDIQGSGGGTLRLRDCLVSDITWGGPVELEYCTILGTVTAQRIAASDSVFLRRPRLFDPTSSDRRGGSSSWPEFICLRYCRIDPDTLAHYFIMQRHATEHHLTVSPVKFVFPEASIPSPSWGAGVLDPLGPADVTAGAEDGGELGCFHHRHYVSRLRAFSDKVQAFLPMGQKMIAQYDASLCCMPPSVSTP